MPDWNQQVIEEFRANQGQVGGRFEGAPMVLLHHVGAKSGQARVSPLRLFPQADGSMFIIASKGGGPTNPDWYHNLLAHPRTEVEVGTRTFTVEAERLDRAERDRVWPQLVAEAPGFGAYQDRSDRVIPVFRLMPVD